MPGTQIFEPGTRELVAAVLPSASEPPFQVGDVLYVGSGSKRLRVVAVEYVLTVSQSPTGQLGEVAGRSVYTEAAPLE